MYKNHKKDTNNNCHKSLLPESKEKLIQAIKRIWHEVDACREAERYTCIEAVEVESSFDDLEREIRAEFQNIHRFLDEEEWTDMQRLRKERDKQVKLLREREKKIIQQRDNFEKAIALLNSKLAEEETSKLLRDIQDLIKRSQVSFIPPAEVDTEVRSGQFVGPIQYRIWKHMKSCLYPNISPVAFDPETAHPNLTLSPCLTSVRFEEDKEVDLSAAEANPDQFHYYYCLLGNQGFTTGRHYWEVEVAGKTAWRLGVARADVDRGPLSSSGPSRGLWTLALKSGGVSACTEPKATRLQVSSRLLRVGVFLDCEKEEVSFYNAVSMMPLFTFSMETALVPLYPFFNPCDADYGKNLAPMTLFTPSL